MTSAFFCIGSQLTTSLHTQNHEFVVRSSSQFLLDSETNRKPINQSAMRESRRQPGNNTSLSLFRFGNRIIFVGIGIAIWLWVLFICYSSLLMTSYISSPFQPDWVTLHQQQPRKESKFTRNIPDDRVDEHVTNGIQSTNHTSLTNHHTIDHNINEDLIEQIRNDLNRSSSEIDNNDTKNDTIPSKETSYNNWTDARILYHMDFIATYKSPVSMYGKHKVDEAMSRLPEWLQHYFQWHAEQRRNPTVDTKYIVITCIGDERCGGLSDRLRPLPYFLLVANATQRVLLIKWTKPHDLSQFLMPARDVDWRLPIEDDDIFLKADKAFCLKDENGYFGYLSGSCSRYKPLCYDDCLAYLAERVSNDTHNIVGLDLLKRSTDQINNGNMLFQKFSYTSEAKILDKWDFPDMFGDIFRVMFQPIPPIGINLNRTMSELGLYEGKYSSAHVRARYPSDQGLKKLIGDLKYVDKSGKIEVKNDVLDYLTKVSQHALSCVALGSDSNSKIYFASDTNDLTKHISTTKHFINEYDENQTLTVVGLGRDDETLHMDGPFGEYSPDKFYSVFEDLLIMGGSRCVSRGMGSFGSFGSALINNKCMYSHRKYNGSSIDCTKNLSKPMMNVKHVVDPEELCQYSNSSVIALDNRYRKKENTLKKCYDV